MRPDIGTLAYLYADLSSKSDDTTWEAGKDIIRKKRILRTARGWMLPASSQLSAGGMCGAMSAGSAKKRDRDPCMPGELQ